MSAQTNVLNQHYCYYLLIQECRNHYYRSSYIYLRGMFYAAENNVESALNDLLSLHAHNARLLPIGYCAFLVFSYEERVKVKNHQAFQFSDHQHHHCHCLSHHHQHCYLTLVVCKVKIQIPKRLKNFSAYASMTVPLLFFCLLCLRFLAL